MGSGRGWLAGDWPSTGAFSTLLWRPGLRASSDNVLATKSERKMLASTCLYSLYAWLLTCLVLFLMKWIYVVVAQSNPTVSDRLYCPTGQYGYFADPTNCSRYAQCAEGRLTDLHGCPYNRHWHVTSPGYGFCDLPQSAGCQLTRLPDPLHPVEPVKSLHAFHLMHDKCLLLRYPM